MPTSDKSCFAAKVFHLNIKNHMAMDPLVTIGRTGTVGQYLKVRTNIFHFGCNGIGPIGVAVLFVNLQCVFHEGRDFNPKLWFCLRYLGMRFLTREIIRSRFFSTWGTHQLKAGSWSIFIIFAYSAISKGCEFLRSVRLSQEVEPSIHWQQIFQPAVERQR